MHIFVIQKIHGTHIKRICMDDNLNKEFSEKAYYLMKIYMTQKNGVKDF